MPKIFVDIHPMSEPLPSASGVQKVTIHEDSTIVLLGTNGKPAGWIDCYTDIAPTFYRDQFIGFDVEQDLKNKYNEMEAQYHKALDTIGALIYNSGGQITINFEDHNNKYDTNVVQDVETMQWIFRAHPSIGDV
jgi:hypothetical protein